MSDPIITYESFAMPPSAEGTTELRAKLYRPAKADGPLPLIVWFHSGGFRTGTIEARGHNRVAGPATRNGYAIAFVQYRLKARTRDLAPATQALLPALIADAEQNAAEINPAFIGAPALAALEDAAAFLSWCDTNAKDQEFSGHYALGGSSAGAMTVLNLLSLAPRLGLILPAIPTAFVMSGAFAYPSFFSPSPTRVLALHGSHEPQIPPSSIRAYAARPDANCTLLEDTEHQHGDLRITRSEPLPRAVRRLAQFDRGTDIAPARTSASAQPVKDRHKICVFTCVKNEGPFLLEWIAHNRAIGVTDFIIFTNDCTDGTTQLLDHLDAMGIVNHIPNPSTALQTRQHLRVAVANAPFHPAFRKADYAILTDVDEFIQINTGDRTLNGLIAATGYPDVISLPELVYGFGGVETYHDRLVGNQFRIARSITPDPDNPRRGVKSIMRVGDHIATFANHRPYVTPETHDTVRWVNGKGQPVTPEFIASKERGFDVSGCYRLARVNHYTLRSGESMLVKYQRGDAVRPARMGRHYFHSRNARDVHDDGFLPHLPALKTELAQLLQDETLARLHDTCVARHREMIEGLKTDPDYTEIWEDIRKQAVLDCLADLPDNTKTAAE